MKCPNCKNEILDESLYCAHCGVKIERCKHCDNVLQSGAHYCSYCGTPVSESNYQPLNEQYSNRLGGYYSGTQQQSNQSEYTNRLGGYYQPINETYKEEYVQETVDFKDIQTSKKVNKKVIILSVLALIVSTALAGVYLSKTAGINPFLPNDNQTITSSTLKVNGENDPYAYIGNINQGGHAFLYKDRIYVCDDNGYLVSMSTSFDDRITLTNHKVEYVSVVDDIIYYVNENMQICSMDIKGNHQAVIVEKEAYYVQVVDKKIYYQSDDDGERLYVFDLVTLENKEINQRVTYEMNITDDKIYYSSTDGIYCIGIDGKGEEKLSSDIGRSLIFKDNKLYYSTTDYETKVLDLNTKTSISLVNERSSLLNMTNDYIFYYSLSGLKKYDVKTKESTVIYTGNLNFLEIVGNVLIITDSDDHRIVMDFNGNNQQRLFLENDQNFV